MNEAINKLNWIGRGAKAVNKNADVSVTQSTRKNGRNTYSIIIRSNLNNLISDTDYVQIALFKNRIFFRPSDANEGLLMYQNPHSPQNRYIKFEGISTTPEGIENFVGNYELKHDAFYELYYIERE